MSTYSSVLWTCDRCGRSQEVGSHAGAPDQPVGWAALWAVKPPLMSPSESDKRPDQICRDCLDSFYEWFTAGSRTAVPA